VLPTLTVNRSFMQAFIAAETPCCALGLVEESGRPCGLIALQPDQEIPAAITDGGFDFGHSLLGTAAFEVIHFAFEFYGFATYNVLINPNNALVQAVLERMIDDGDYFFFSLEASGRITAFRAEIGQETLAGIRVNRSRIRQSTTTEMEYRKALSAFAANPEPEGTLLHWVCRDTIDYLDLTHDRLTLNPA
jgi:hypothetical protein